MKAVVVEGTLELLRTNHGTRMGTRPAVTGSC